MKWFIVVLFAGVYSDGSQDLYVFKTPTFESRDECIGSITDPQAIPNYVQHLFEEYGTMKRIQAVNCVSEDVLNSSEKGKET